MEQQGLNLMATDGDGWIAGVDEAGRGPLAGPVVVAAVILHPDRVPSGLNDSKKLAPKRRELLARRIRDCAVDFRIEVCEAPEIDRLNILACTMSAMGRAVAGLEPAPQLVRVDGNRLPPSAERIDAGWEALVSGDSRDAAIAAASILAKTTRDEIMVSMDARWPQYGFAQHKGYGTKAHMAALQEHGPCVLHRRSFAPVRHALERVAEVDA